MLIAVAGQLALLGILFLFAVALRRKLSLEISPPPPPPTSVEARWLDELSSLQLERRHLYC